MQLITKNPRRFFAFGCSFTHYYWSSWPEIIAFDLNIPFYNYGQSGAGNQYIANMVCQADAIHKFTKDDLIVVSWTNVAREDRWIDGQWITPGNIYTQGIYDNKFVEKWADPIGYLIRDLSSIKLIKQFLFRKGCEFHFLSMCNIVSIFDQSSGKGIVPEKLKSKYEKLLFLYDEEINFIQPSFFDILWNNDINKNKFALEESKGFTYFKDGHPYPEEHFVYLKNVFNQHTFNIETQLKIKEIQENFLKFIENKNQEFKKYWAVYELSKKDSDNLINLTKIKSSEIIEKI